MMTSSNKLFLSFMVVILSSDDMLLVSEAQSKTLDANKRICFTEYDDFIPGNLNGDWSGLTDREWEREEKTGRRKRVRDYITYTKPIYFSYCISNV